MKNLVLTPGVIATLNTLSRSMRHRILDAAMTYCITGTLPEGFSKSATAILSLVIECSEISQKQAEKAQEKEPEQNEQAPKETDAAHAADAPTLEQITRTIKQNFADARSMTREKRAEEREMLAEIKKTVCNRIGALKCVG